MSEEQPEITEREEWEFNAKQAGLVRGMIEHKGWKDVVAPALQGRRDGLLQRLLGGDLNKAEEFVTIRQSINAIDSINNFIKVTLALGEVATENLKKEMEQKQAN